MKNEIPSYRGESAPIADLDTLLPIFSFFLSYFAFCDMHYCLASGDFRKKIKISLDNGNLFDILNGRLLVNLSRLWGLLKEYLF